VQKRISIAVAWSLATFVEAGAANPRPATAAGSASDRPVTCAVVFDRGSKLADSPLAALLEVKLSGQSGINLIERAEVGRILKEHSLVLSGSTYQSRREWGQLLRADLLVFLHTRTVEKAQVLDIVFVETKHGFHLGQDLLSWSDRSEELASLVVQRVLRTASRTRAEVRFVFAVPPFVSEDILPDSLARQTSYAKVIEATVSSCPGVIVVDLEHATEVAKELAVSAGDNRVTRSLPFYFQGKYRTSGPITSRSVSLRLELRYGPQVVASASKENLAVTDVGPTLRALALKMVGDAGGTPPSNEDAQARELEAGLLEERARAYHAIGEFETSAAMAEACLLLDPGRAEVHRLARHCLADLLNAYVVQNQAAHSAAGRSDRVVHPVPADRILRTLLLMNEHLYVLAHLQPLRDEDWRRSQSSSWRAVTGSIGDCLGRWPCCQASFPPEVDGLVKEQWSPALECVLYILRNHRTEGPEQEERLSELAVDAARLAGFAAAHVSAEEGRRALIEALVALAPFDDALQLEWKALESWVNRGCRAWPRPMREAFLADLETVPAKNQAVLTRCIRVFLWMEVPDQVRPAEDKLRAICAEGFPGQPFPPPPLKRLFDSFVAQARLMDPDYRKQPIAPPEPSSGKTGLPPAAKSEDGSVIFTAIEGLPPKGPHYWLVSPGGFDMLCRRDVPELTVVRTPSTVEHVPLPTDEARRIGQAVYDGRYVWLRVDGDSRSPSQIQVREMPGGERVAVFDGSEGLPAFGSWSPMAALGPGQVCLATSLGDPGHIQTWVGRLSISRSSGGSVAKNADLVFSARKSCVPDKPGGPLRSDVDSGFMPWRAVTVPDAGQGDLLLIWRRFFIGNPENHFPVLIVDPMRRTGQVTPQNWAPECGVAVVGSRMYVLANREGKFPWSPALYVAESPTFELREVAALGGPYGESTVPTSMVLMGDYLHGVGHFWTTIDLRTMKLVRRVRLQNLSVWSYLVISNSYGLVVYNQEGVWQVSFRDGPGPATRPVAASGPAGPD
jgi:hypothetical protein